MPRKKYPLEPLARLKEERAKQKTHELGRAASTREAAQRKREGAEAEREAARATARRIRDEERGSLENGALSVRDLVQASAWESRVGVEDAERTRSVDRALVAEDQARAAEAVVREDLSRAHAESEIVQRHHERWRAAVTKDEESREEEALAEAFRPKITR
jgi:hypothetical protein